MRTTKSFVALVPFLLVSLLFCSEKPAQDAFPFQQPMAESMRFRLALYLLPGPASDPAIAPELPSYAFLNGKWFDGESFKSRVVYAVDGRFTFQKPKAVNKTLDLKGAYVVPPFAEAHNHNFTSQYQADEMIPRYLKEGVFYVKMQSNLPHFSGQILHRFNRPQSVDVTFANGPLTATGGHPVALRERLL